MSKNARRFSSATFRKKNPLVQRWEVLDEMKVDDVDINVEYDIHSSYSTSFTDVDVRVIHNTVIERRTIINNQHVSLRVSCNALNKYSNKHDVFPNVAVWYVCASVLDSIKLDRDWHRSKVFQQSTGRSGLQPLIWINRQLERIESILKNTRGIIFVEFDNQKRESAYLYLLKRGYEKQSWYGVDPFIKELFPH
jgi:hypothetical protein